MMINSFKCRDIHTPSRELNTLLVKGESCFSNFRFFIICLVHSNGLLTDTIMCICNSGDGRHDGVNFISGLQLQ